MAKPTDKQKKYNPFLKMMEDEPCIFTILLWGLVESGHLIIEEESKTTENKDK